MKSTNRKRALLVSCAVILLCMTIIAGMTFALFTDEQPIKNHLQAGNLEITLARTKLVKTTLDKDGYLAETTVQSESDAPVYFSDSADENVFGIGADEKIVPGTKYVATMQLENHSDVAFGYWIEIKCTDATKGANLAKQIKVTVNAGNSESAIVGNGLIVGSEKSPVGEVKVTQDEQNPVTATFTVTVEFLDSFVNENGLGYYDNDLAKDETIAFDLIVHAVQATKAPTP